MTDQPEEVDRFVGKLLSDRYRIIRKIGEGGMGTVYEALHEAIEKKIALKVLHAQYSSSPEVVHRFKQEAISASRIKHQNVIDVFDFGQLGDGSCFIAMEFLEGQDLGDALEKKRSFKADEAIRITLQMTRALGLGHGRGVIHRDLKPENVFLQLTPEGEEVVKIVDFGIAQLRNNDEQPAEEEARPRRLTKTGMIFGTPEYMAPEQARGAAIDQRSDIYATGVILYELLTGAVPFLGESFLEVLNQHVQSKVPPLKEANSEISHSAELERVVMRTLEKDPDDRYATMKDFAAALLKTPEGRKVRMTISSISTAELPEDDGFNAEARIENSRYPKPQDGGGTAMFGSSAEAAELVEDAPVELPTKSSGGLTLGVIAALVLILGGGGYFLMGSGDQSPAPEPTPAPAPEPTPAPAPAPEPKEEPTEPQESSPEESKSVLLSVVTDPPGGVVKKGDFQVCSAAPCEVTVDPGEAVTLTAEKGKAKGEAKVLAQKNQEVVIQLVAPKVLAPRPRPPAKRPAKPALCEVMVDGIKILRPCQ